MKIYLVLFVIFVCGCVKGKDTNDVNIEEYLNLVGLQENVKERIYRPCHLRDITCIRKYFAKNSNCNIAKGPAPDPLILDRNTIFLPFVNSSIILNNFQISGLNDAEIKEFYVNKVTGNLVLSFSIAGLSERSTRTSFRYKRTVKEPIVLTDFSTATFRQLTFTAVIPKVPNLQLHKADIHGFIDDTNPQFIVGNNSFNSTDESVQRKFVTMTSDLPSTLREAFHLKSTLYSIVFIQSNICDFGLPVGSV